MSIADIKKTAEQKINKTVETLKNDLGKVRTGRAHPGIIDHVMVDYYGTMMPIGQVANVTLADGRTISVQRRAKSARCSRSTISSSERSLSTMK